MNRVRFVLIHYFFSTNNVSSSLNVFWFYRIQYITDLIRTVYRNFYYFSFNIVINKVMIVFKSRLKYTIKLKNKSINIDYKL